MTGRRDADSKKKMQKLSFSCKINLNLYEFDQPSIHVYVKGPCNMNCYGCFNIGSLFRFEESDLDMYAMVDYIERQKDLFEFIVLTGGEVFTAPLPQLKEALTLIRTRLPNKKLIVYTNGLNYPFLAALDGTIGFDGIHLDLKLPYHLLDPESDQELIKLTLGRPLSRNDIDNLLKSVEHVIANDRGYSQIRTVKYPFATVEMWEESKILISKLNIKHNKNTPYKLNKFIEMEEIK